MPDLAEVIGSVGNCGKGPTDDLLVILCPRAIDELYEPMLAIPQLFLKVVPLLLRYLGLRPTGGPVLPPGIHAAHVLEGDIEIKDQVVHLGRHARATTTNRPRCIGGRDTRQRWKERLVWIEKGTMHIVERLVEDEEQRIAEIRYRDCA